MSMKKMDSLDFFVKLIILGALFVCSEAFSETLTPPFNIQVEVDSLNVRDAPPWFSWKTVLTGEYRINPPIDVLAKAQQANVSEKRLVGSGKLWLYIRYIKNGMEKTGWVYAGTEQNIVNIKILDDSDPLPPNGYIGSGNTSRIAQNGLIGYFIGSVLAGAPAVSTQESGNNQIDPDLGVQPASRVLVLLIYVVTFVISLLSTYKITSNGFLSFFVGLGVLLILGFITPELFSTSLGIFN